MVVSSFTEEMALTLREHKVGELAQRLRALNALPEDPRSIHGTQMGVHKCNPIPGPPKAPGMNMVHRHHAENK